MKLSSVVLRIYIDCKIFRDGYRLGWIVEAAMRRDSIFWGVLLVLLGGLFLMDNLGYLPAGVNVWALFWPFLLIGVEQGLHRPSEPERFRSGRSTSARPAGSCSDLLPFRHAGRLMQARDWRHGAQAARTRHPAHLPQVDNRGAAAG